jgi:hypothetical protein
MRIPANNKASVKTSGFILKIVTIRPFIAKTDVTKPLPLFPVKHQLSQVDFGFKKRSICPSCWISFAILLFPCFSLQKFDPLVVFSTV